MTVFLSYLILCFCAAALLQRRPPAWRIAMIGLVALAVCGAYYFLHTL